MQRRSSSCSHSLNGRSLSAQLPLPRLPPRLSHLALDALGPPPTLPRTTPTSLASSLPHLRHVSRSSHSSVLVVGSIQSHPRHRPLSQQRRRRTRSMRRRRRRKKRSGWRGWRSSSTEQRRTSSPLHVHRLPSPWSGQERTTAHSPHRPPVPPAPPPPPPTPSPTSLPSASDLHLHLQPPTTLALLLPSLSAPSSLASPCPPFYATCPHSTPPSSPDRWLYRSRS